MCVHVLITVGAKCESLNMLVSDKYELFVQKQEVLAYQAIPHHATK